MGTCIAIAGEANAMLCMSHLIVEAQVGLQVPTIPSSMRHVQPCPQEDLSCTDSGVQVSQLG